MYWPAWRSVQSTLPEGELTVQQMETLTLLVIPVSQCTLEITQFNTPVYYSLLVITDDLDEFIAALVW